MVFRPSTILVLLSALSYYYVSGAVVSLLVPDADPDQALAGQFLGTDAQGHTSWSIGPGVPSGSFTDTDFPGITLVAGATDIHEVAAFSTLFADVTLTITASEGCAFATPASGGAVSASCSVSEQVVGAISTTTTTSTLSTVYTSLATLVPVQVPDSGSGAIPTAAATSPSGTTSGTGSAPASTGTKSGASKGGINWGVAGPASLFILVAGLM